MKLEEAIEAVLNECPDEYAKSYAKALARASLLYGSEGEAAQILYILANMEEWTGPRADEVRKVLKRHRE